MPDLADLKPTSEDDLIQHIANTILADAKERKDARYLPAIPDSIDLSDHFQAYPDAPALKTSHKLCDELYQALDWYTADYWGIEDGACPIANGLQLHSAWQELPEEKRMKFPLIPLVAAWMRRPLPVRQSNAKLLASKGRGPLILTRIPAHLSLATSSLEAVPGAKGQPVGTRMLELGRVRAAPEDQYELLPYPRTLDGRATAGLLVRCISELLGPPTDDRTSIRSDIMLLGTIAFALNKTVLLTPSTSSLMLTGKDTPVGRRRAEEALWGLRYLFFRRKDGTRVALMDSEPGYGANLIGPARWIQAGQGPIAWKNTHTLFRRQFRGYRRGGLERFVSGLELGLAWGKTGGKGKYGRHSVYTLPANGAASGPGPTVAISWPHTLRLSGEPVADSEVVSPSRGNTHYRRYENRLKRLEEAGYFVDASTGKSTAGDTIEIVGRIPAGPGQRAGIYVRYTEEGTAATKSGKHISIPAESLLEPWK